MKYELVCKILTLHNSIEVTDEKGELAYRAVSRFASITDKSEISDGQGQKVARFYRKVISIHRIHTIEMVGGEVLTLKTELLHLMKDVIDVEENGWKLKGNFAEHKYRIVDRDDKVLAQIDRPWAAAQDKCRIDVKEENFTDQLAALIIVLEHMLIDGRESETVAAGATASVGTATAAGTTAAVGENCR